MNHQQTNRLVFATEEERSAPRVDPFFDEVNVSAPMGKVFEEVRLCDWEYIRKIFPNVTRP